MIRTSTDFKYAGTSSIDMNIINVNLDRGPLLEEPLVANREILEIEIPGKDSPYFNKIKLSPLTFTLNLAFAEPLTTSGSPSLDQIKSWLFQSYYKPLIFYDDITMVGDPPVETINKQYYAIAVGDPTISHNGLSEGYCTVEFRCDSPYAYSSTKTSSIGASTTINNLGTTLCYPRITIVTTAAGNVTITNISDGNRATTFTDLADNETITVDCEKKIINTNLQLTYRYSNFNGNYLYLKPGNNILAVSGSANISMQYEFRYL